MDKVLILGAGIYQVPLIKKAKELGYYTVVCSINGNYPGFAYADKVYYVNTTDKDACLDIAKKEKIVGVCTTGTDVALPTLGHIVDNLHLKGPSEKSATLSSNKLLMQEAFHKHGVKSARYFRINTKDDCIKYANEIGYPCILKVVDSSGSRGIQVVKSESELLGSFYSIKKYTHKNYVIVEEYLEGVEFGAQAFICEGRLLFVMPHADEVYQGKAGVPIGHHVPFIHPNSNSILKKVYFEIEKAVKAMDIDNSAVNVDMILVNDTPYLLEIGARGGGTCLPELVSLYYDVDYYKMIIQVATGELRESDYIFIPQRAVTGLIITSPKSGIISNYNLDLSDGSVYNLSMDYKKGQHVHKFETGPDRIGQLIVFGNDAIITRNKAFKLLSDIHLEIIEH